MDGDQPERHINLHTSPEVMAGIYANFANVSHSDYEFTITFARVDHEADREGSQHVDLPEALAHASRMLAAPRRAAGG